MRLSIATEQTWKLLGTRTSSASPGRGPMPDEANLSSAETRKPGAWRTHRTLTVRPSAAVAADPLNVTDAPVPSRWPAISGSVVDGSGAPGSGRAALGKGTPREISGAPN